MKKLPLAVVAAALLALPSAASAQTAAPTPLDYYKLGQFLQTTTNSQYLVSPSKNALQQRLADERRDLAKLNPPPAVLNAYDKMANTYSELPFTTAWTTWTPAQQSTYVNTGMDWNAVNAWLGSGDTVPRFYFWLGFQTMFIAKTAPMELNSLGYTLVTVQSSFTAPLADFNSFATAYPATFATAIPAVQNAIKTIATYNGKPPAAADIASMQTQAQIIYDAANGKISR